MNEWIKTTTRTHVGVGAVGLFGIAGFGIWMQTGGSLPALDRIPGSVQVMFNTDDADGRQSLCRDQDAEPDPQLLENPSGS
ncbi:hypothetical protein QF046_000042 [Microbacterium sp. W4I4]|uniref:hypothetical protein n=1 Tax=Microbacterium sp. W4I4 TaxID=3042295 RepID=UPI002788950F|nr:hypothetical protein [Microbacterium sp. W4I4]MDQ0612401.1 hypothetical protein [Microbacterium sp. W4I4]